MTSSITTNLSPAFEEAVLLKNLYIKAYDQKLRPPINLYDDSSDELSDESECEFNYERKILEPVSEWKISKLVGLTLISGIIEYLKKNQDIKITVIGKDYTSSKPLPGRTQEEWDIFRKAIQQDSSISRFQVIGLHDEEGNIAFFDLCSLYGNRIFKEQYSSKVNENKMITYIKEIFKTIFDYLEEVYLDKEVPYYWSLNPIYQSKLSDEFENQGKSFLLDGQYFGGATQAKVCLVEKNTKYCLWVNRMLVPGSTLDKI